MLGPQNVLWCYYASEENDSAAREIWQKHLQTSATVLYGPILSEASKLRNETIIIKLIDYLKTSAVSPSIGGPYSCLLHIYCDKELHELAFQTLQNAIDDGLPLENIHTTALQRIKDGIEKNGKTFPYKIRPR